MRDFTAELIQNNLDAKVSGTNKPSNTLSAIVETEVLSTTINKNVINITIESNKLTGVINEC